MDKRTYDHAWNKGFEMGVGFACDELNLPPAQALVLLQIYDELKKTPMKEFIAKQKEKSNG
jgi:hypothetical protein